MLANIQAIHPCCLALQIKTIQNSHKQPYNHTLANIQAIHSSCLAIYIKNNSQKHPYRHILANIQAICPRFIVVYESMYFVLSQFAASEWSIFSTSVCHHMFLVRCGYLSALSHFYMTQQRNSQCVDILYVWSVSCFVAL